MRVVFIFFWLLSSPILWAAPEQSNSTAAINSINVLHDPTAMNKSFRQALQGLPQKGRDLSTPTETDVDEEGELLLPNIELVARVISNKKPNTVVFKIRDKYIHFKQGSQASIVVNHEVVTLTVEIINERLIRLRVMPFNEVLIF